MKTKTFPLLIAIFALAGCETPEQRFERLLPVADARCGAYGHTKGSPTYATCVQSEVSRLEDKEDQEEAAIAASIQAATPKSSTCYTSGYGYTSTTTCY